MAFRAFKRAWGRAEVSTPKKLPGRERAAAREYLLGSKGESPLIGTRAGPGYSDATRGLRFGNECERLQVTGFRHRENEKPET